MILQSNDIFLRPLTNIDINAKYISWFADPIVTRFLEARNISIEDSKKYLQNGIETGLYYIFAICINRSNLHIGNVKIGPIKRQEGVSDLVTVLGDRKYWGQGIASIAIQKAIEIGFKEAKIRKFSASINSLNIGSIRAYLKGGFKEEAVISNYFYNDINNEKTFSDKVFVGIENDNYDMDILKNWKPST